MKQIEVQIMAQSYLLACPTGGEAALREAVTKVDAAMCRIRDAGKVKARDRIAVLAALNIAYELHQKELGNFRNTSFGQTEAGEWPDPIDRLQENRLQQLLERLDQALTQDGRLL
ncbi:MAG: cell division protein ZapA [Serpentinimonas sp.]|nr:cell division protein ZapA [Serpentinimonas sp.]